MNNIKKVVIILFWLIFIIDLNLGYCIPAKQYFAEDTNTNSITLKNLKDTLYIYYHIPYYGEYGGIVEGVLLYSEQGNVLAEYISYCKQYNRYSEISTVEERKFSVVKEPWQLNKQQIDSVEFFISEKISYKPQANLLSNAIACYRLSYAGNDILVRDPANQLKIYKKDAELSKHQSYKTKNILFVGNSDL